MPGGHRRPPGAVVTTQGFRPNRRWDDPAASGSSSWSHSPAHHRHIQPDRPVTLQRTPQTARAPGPCGSHLEQGDIKRSRKSCFTNSVFRASGGMLGPDWGNLVPRRKDSGAVGDVPTQSLVLSPGLLQLPAFGWDCECGETPVCMGGGPRGRGTGSVFRSPTHLPEKEEEEEESIRAAGQGVA